MVEWRDKNEKKVDKYVREQAFPMSYSSYPDIKSNVQTVANRVV